MAKELKIWNGRGHGAYIGWTIYVAAYSIKQAAEIVGIASGLRFPVGVNEIREYYSKGLWGIHMEGVVPTEPCAYVGKNFGKESNDKPKQVYPIIKTHRNAKPKKPGHRKIH